MLSPRRTKVLTEFIQQWKLTFNDLSLLDLALTHSSFKNESKKHFRDNERLEYLGDSVLGLVVNDYLYHTLDEAREGRLARIKSSVVSEKSLARVATRMNLGDYLLMGKGERLSGGGERASNLADALEAVMGAVYLDQGLEGAQKFILAVFRSQIGAAFGRSQDAKTRLQELVQHQIQKTPEYEIVSESGPAHARDFVCRVLVDGKEKGRGKGSSRRRAELQAAMQALKQY